MTRSVGFIGLGSMGLPMARNLLRAGYQVRVYNRSRDKAMALAKDGAIVVASPAEAAAAGIVLTMVANDEALDAIVSGPEGIGEALGAGGLHVSMSTISPATARRLANAQADRGGHYVAAPVFGRPEAAAAKKLWICLSGADAAKDRARPVLEALSQGIHDFGVDPGAANVVKLCGNFLILAVLESLGEALALAEKSGLDRVALASFFGETLFACPIYQNYGRILAHRSFEPAGFRLELGLKDANLIADAANAAKVPMPLGHLIQERMLAGMANGHHDLDWAAMELQIAEAAGLKPR